MKIFITLLCLSILSTTSEAIDLQSKIRNTDKGILETIPDTETLEKGKMNFSIGTSITNNPLIEVNNKNQETILIDGLWDTEFSMTYGLFDWWEIGVLLPYMKTLEPAASLKLASDQGIGDLVLESKFNLFPGISILPSIIAPTGDQDSFRGSGGGFGLKLIGSSEKWWSSKFPILFSVGRISTPNSKYRTIDHSSRMQYAVGTAYNLTSQLSLGAELYGESTTNNSPLEIMGHATLHSNKFSVRGGMSSGVLSSDNSNELRLFASIIFDFNLKKYSPPTPPVTTAPIKNKSTQDETPVSSKDLIQELKNINTPEPESKPIEKEEVAPTPQDKSQEEIQEIRKYMREPSSINIQRSPAGTSNKIENEFIKTHVQKDSKFNMLPFVSSHRIGEEFKISEDEWNKRLQTQPMSKLVKKEENIKHAYQRYLEGQDALSGLYHNYLDNNIPLKQALVEFNWGLRVVEKRRNTLSAMNKALIKKGKKIETVVDTDFKKTSHIEDMVANLLEGNKKLFEQVVENKKNKVQAKSLEKKGMNTFKQKLAEKAGMDSVSQNKQDPESHKNTDPLPTLANEEDSGEIIEEDEPATSEEFIEEKNQELSLNTNEEETDMVDQKEDAEKKEIVVDTLPPAPLEEETTYYNNNEEITNLSLPLSLDLPFSPLAREMSTQKNQNPSPLRVKPEAKNIEIEIPLINTQELVKANNSFQEENTTASLEEVVEANNSFQEKNIAPTEEEGQKEETSLISKAQTSKEIAENNKGEEQLTKTPSTASQDSNITEKETITKQSPVVVSAKDMEKIKEKIREDELRKEQEAAWELSKTKTLQDIIKEKKAEKEKLMALNKKTLKPKTVPTIQVVKKETPLKTIQVEEQVLTKEKNNDIELDNNKKEEVEQLPISNIKVVNKPSSVNKNENKKVVKSKSTITKEKPIKKEVTKTKEDLTSKIISSNPVTTKEDKSWFIPEIISLIGSWVNGDVQKNKPLFSSAFEEEKSEINKLIEKTYVPKKHTYNKFYNQYRYEKKAVEVSEPNINKMVEKIIEEQKQELGEKPPRIFKYYVIEDTPAPLEKEEISQDKEVPSNQTLDNVPVYTEEYQVYSEDNSFGLEEEGEIEESLGPRY